MLVAPGYGKDIRTFPTPPTTPNVPRSKQTTTAEPSKPQPSRSRHNSERSGDFCSNSICFYSDKIIPIDAYRALSPIPSGGAPASPRRMSSPFQVQLAANQIIGHHILTSTQFNKDQVILDDDIITNHVILTLQFLP